MLLYLIIKPSDAIAKKESESKIGITDEHIENGEEIVIWRRRDRRNKMFQKKKKSAQTEIIEGTNGVIDEQINICIIYKSIHMQFARIANMLFFIFIYHL